MSVDSIIDGGAAEASAATHKIASKVKDEAKSFADAADDATDTARTTLKRAAHRAKARRQAAIYWARGRGEQANEAVRGHPFIAVAAALGAGLAIGLLSRARHHA